MRPLCWVASCRCAATPSSHRTMPLVGESRMGASYAPPGIAPPTLSGPQPPPTELCCCHPSLPWHYQPCALQVQLAMFIHMGLKLGSKSHFFCVAEASFSDFLSARFRRRSGQGGFSDLSNRTFMDRFPWLSRINIASCTCTRYGVQAGHVGGSG